MPAFSLHAHLTPTCTSGLSRSWTTLLLFLGFDTRDGRLGSVTFTFGPGGGSRCRAFTRRLVGLLLALFAELGGPAAFWCINRRRINREALDLVDIQHIVVVVVIVASMHVCSVLVVVVVFGGFASHASDEFPSEYDGPGSLDTGSRREFTQWPE